MTLDQVAAKSIPPLMVLSIAAMSALFIKVNTLETKVLTLEKDDKERKKDTDRTNQKQWEFIMNTNKGVIELQERCVSKDQFYKDVWCKRK